MKTFKIVCIIFLSALFLSGCAGHEPNEIAYVVALGIDNAENGNYKITIQYANPEKISGGEEGGDTADSGVENLVLTAPDIFAAIGLADQLESKAFSLSHTKLIIVSRETAENGLKDMAEIFIRNEELRPDVYLTVTLGSAEEYLQNINPTNEINPAKYYKMIFDRKKLAGLPEGILKNFYIGAYTGNYDLLLPIAHTSKQDIIGSAVFKNGKMVGQIGAYETEIYKLLDKEHAEGYLTLRNESNFKDPVTIKTVQKKKPKYSIDTENKTITVKLTLVGDIYAISPEYNIDTEFEKFKKSCEEYVNEECENLMRRVLSEYDSDIFRINERVKTKFLTDEDYEFYKTRADYSDYDIRVDTSFEIRRAGLIVKSI